MSVKQIKDKKLDKYDVLLIRLSTIGSGEKEILSLYGEKKSKRLSENKELKNIDVIWSSGYTRAKAIAKYIADNNKLCINIDSNLLRRSENANR